ncbi:MAG: tetratricopeptide repeat protein, partial [Myxococcales bacterium]|nr:tetratricopeptide repeat protein [Myxococcales bacterium]
MRRPILVGLVGSLAASLVGVAYLQHRSTEGEEALARAQAVLTTPFALAPELHDLEVGEALAALDEAEERGATHPALRHDLEALAHLKRGDLIFAEGSLTAARHADGWSVSRHVVAAAIARAADNPEVAREHVRAALSEDSDEPRALLLEADLALDAHEGRVAKRALEALLEVGSRLPSLHNRLGLAHELLGDDEAAEQEFRRALALADDFVEAWVNLGRTLRARGEADEAYLAFTAATEHAVGDANAWLGRGLCALDAGRFDEAREALDRALE